MTLRRALVAIGLTIALAIGLCTPAWAGEAPDAVRRQEIETIVREYLRAHPEVVLEALQEMERREQERQRAQRAETIRAHLAQLTQDPASPVAGNPRGKVTVVEFFDYQCGYCKRQEGELKKLLQADADVRLVYKDLPILGPPSVFAARAALAARKQGKHAALHDLLMTVEERLTEQLVLDMAVRSGLDIAQLEKDMADPSVSQVLDRNLQLQRALHIEGTPALIVGTEFIPGAASVETLKALVARARAQEAPRSGEPAPVGAPSVK